MSGVAGNCHTYTKLSNNKTRPKSKKESDFSTMAISRFSLKTENLATLGSYRYSASCSGLASATHHARQPSARACANCQVRIWTGESSTKTLASQPTFIGGCSSHGEASSVSPKCVGRVFPDTTATHWDLCPALSAVSCILQIATLLLWMRLPDPWGCKGC